MKRSRARWPILGLGLRAPGALRRIITGSRAEPGPGRSVEFSGGEPGSRRQPHAAGHAGRSRRRRPGRRTCRWATSGTAVPASVMVMARHDRVVPRQASRPAALRVRRHPRAAGARQERLLPAARLEAPTTRTTTPWTTTQQGNIFTALPTATYNPGVAAASSTSRWWRRFRLSSAGGAASAQEQQGTREGAVGMLPAPAGDAPAGLADHRPGRGRLSIRRPTRNTTVSGCRSGAGTTATCWPTLTAATCPPSRPGWDHGMPTMTR